MKKRKKERKNKKEEKNLYQRANCIGQVPPY